MSSAGRSGACASASTIARAWCCTTWGEATAWWRRWGKADCLELLLVRCLLLWIPSICDQNHISFFSAMLASLIAGVHQRLDCAACSCRTGCV